MGTVRSKVVCVALLLVSLIFFASHATADSGTGAEQNMKKNEATIVLGGGCFWCMEAIFQNFKGIDKVESGYSGGTMENPSYEDVASQTTGHAEVVQVTFDSTVISLDQVLTIFFHAHDPTTLNRQGNDVGPEYRSIILYSSEEQKQAAEKIKSAIAAEKVWGNQPLVTEILPLKKFYRAEDYHQDYYKNNPRASYCSFVIAPKVQKIRKEFAALLK